jgi:hypothetical protein
MKKNLSRERIRVALGPTTNLPKLYRAVHELTDDELARVEELERLGARRHNTLRALMAERKRRAGRGGKMLRLKVEGVR